MSRAVRRPALTVLLATLLALLAALVPGSGVQAGPASPPGSANASPARTAAVMTRNLYLGADLNPIILALVGGNPSAIVTAATQTWNAVQATRPQERMAAVADEIVAADAAVVGLQEVTTWTTFDYDPQTQAVTNPTVAYDFLDLLLDALAARGADYREVAGATAHNFTSPPIPVLAGAAFPTEAVRLADRDVIIARDDVAATNARTGTYQNIISFPVGGQVLPVTRGWGSADVRVERARFRFVNSHLEAFGVPGIDGEQVRVAQVGELLAAQAAVTAQSGALPMVYVGDYNSRAPDAPAYTRLLAGVGVDAWVRNHPNDAGLTCCFDDAVSDPTDPLTSRIDLVLVSRDVKAPRATVVGDDSADMTPSGLWPSDHAGVVARLVFPARH
jgi:endonuclease/exonuclease/phosphatase family metal-dependent hydrolase